MGLSTAFARLLPQRSLRFQAGLAARGRIRSAQGAANASYQHGAFSKELPLCAWREPSEGGIQVIALGATFEASLPMMERIEASVQEGRPVHSVFWPVRSLRGGYHVRKVPVEMRRDGTGLTFTPLCLGTSPIRVPRHRLGEFLGGERVSDPPNVPASALPAPALTHERLLTAARDSGLLSKRERFEAAVGIAWTRCLQVGVDGVALRKIRAALDALREGLSPILEDEAPDTRGLALAHKAIEALVASDLSVNFGKAGHLFLTAEVVPLLALAERRKSSSPERARDVLEAEMPSPAFA